MAATLTSEHNPLIKQARRAAARGSLTEDGYALAEGPHLLDEALRSRVEIGAVILAESAPDPSLPVTSQIRIIRLADRAFASLASTETPQGILTLVRPRDWSLPDLFPGGLPAPSRDPVPRQDSIGASAANRDAAADPANSSAGVQDARTATPLLVVLDRIQDPGNAGAILRTAEAFGATGAIFLTGSVNPYNPKCMRASAGSIFRLPLLTRLTPGALPDLPLFAADPRAPQSLDQADLARPCALIIGAEGPGIDPALLARATGLRIPTTAVESLNAAVAAGILLYEARRQRGLP